MRIQRGYSDDIVGIQGGYSEHTVRIQWGYSEDTVRIQGGYNGDTVRIQWGYSGDTVRGMAIDSQCNIRTTVEKTQLVSVFIFIHYLHTIMVVAIEEKAIYNVIQISLFIILDVFVLTMSSF